MSELNVMTFPHHPAWSHHPSGTDTAQNKTRPLPAISIGHLAEDDQGKLFLPQHAGLRLTTATSCLIQPRTGDLVSAIVHQQQVFVISILQRQQADAPLELNSGEIPLHLRAPALEIHTHQFALFSKTSQWVARTLHQVADALFIRAKHAHRQVENTDELQARHISQHAEQSLIINSRIGSLNASAVLKIDGGQVHMG